MSDNEGPQPPKKRKVAGEGSSGGSNIPNNERALVVAGQFRNAEPAQADGNASTLLPREFERLALTVNPDYVDKLRYSKTIGFARPAAQRIAAPRYYQINIVNFRNALSAVATDYLKIKFYEQGLLTYAEVDAELEELIPVLVNACMAALYSKLRNIHKSFQTYATRFNAPPSYSKEIELPLPFADAIQNFGVFSPVGTTTNYLCVPVYPEGVQNEGRSTQNWQSYTYESLSTYMRDLGIPLKSVDTRLKTGSPWWTYRREYRNGHYDLRCIFSPANYSDHSALLASVFLSKINAQNVARDIIAPLADDVLDYPVRLREIPDGFQLRAFSALCHAPREEWNQYLLLK